MSAGSSNNVFLLRSGVPIPAGAEIPVVEVLQTASVGARSAREAAAAFVTGYTLGAMERKPGSGGMVYATLGEIQNRYDSLRDTVIAGRLRGLVGVDGVFMSTDDRGNTVVYVVTHEQTDTLYDEVVDAEVELAATLADSRLEIRARAHQGRPPAEAVPEGARSLWER